MTQQQTVHEWLIPSKEGRSFQLAKGQTLKVIDVNGQQVADFVAYRESDSKERLDPSVTMDALRTMSIKPGDLLYSNLYTPMLTLLEDTVGKHDFINSACRPEMYEFLYNKPNHQSCYHNLNTALSEFGIPQPDQHYPFNIFMNTVIDGRGDIQIEAPLSAAGDYITLRAEMDVIIAISACPCEESVCNGYQCTPIRVEIT
ncbi:urea carboxylase-associated family protein [Paenibacillus radicis (ex Xue et al. 2023)]|uniref:Urea carboxylase-associated family protein n=1 Tax=Paenibacillus radicis (ex Xue et al. 2023) TaxID=2972489 RepID=A0ABT1YRW2_9BACL|nr:urea carboxylase-associated family protein [Paenibacillus radicis (ex Xue et al. 2023)]MCR8635480.1 urea carboxylase-associated family protein [Paenibacillus radicis (ex Xue et al. 2023)]